MRTKIGKVISDRMEKTVVVKVESYKTNLKYKKRFRVSKKYYAHDPEKKHKIGDTVTIYECRPLSRLKRWTTVSPSSS